jgi:hypothetical protein
MVVADWGLLGRPLAGVLAEQGRACSLPKTIILANSNEERRQALEAGADAAVLKGAPPIMLLEAFDRVRKN